MTTNHGLLLLIATMLSLVACGDSEETRPETHAGPLAAVTARTFSDAFERLDEEGYVARVTFSGDRLAGESPGKQTCTVQVKAGEVLDQICTPSAREGGGIILRDPLPHLIPAAPPYLDPRTREFYSVEIRTEGTGDTLVIAELRPNAPDDLAIKRVELDIMDGTPTMLVVHRQTESLLLDEAERASILLAPHEGAFRPAHLELETTVDLPGGDPISISQSWQILEVGGIPMER